MKAALITGGTGSFGRTMLNRLLEQKYDKIRIYSRDEDKQHSLRSKINDDRVEFYIGDIRNQDRLRIAMIGITHVFHAAALKQVPSCEFFPNEAVQTNILGSENVMEAAISCGVEKVVMLSTDKAVFPINAMGMSKALMEKLVAAKARLQPDCKTIFSIVRYGNVTGSRGSVIPLFIDKILNDQPLTITNPEMTRFLLPLPQTVQLVEHAFEHANQGDFLCAKHRPPRLQTWRRRCWKYSNQMSAQRQSGSATGKNCMKPWHRHRKLDVPRIWETISEYRLIPVILTMNYITTRVMPPLGRSKIITPIIPNSWIWREPRNCCCLCRWYRKV